MLPVTMQMTVVLTEIRRLLVNPRVNFAADEFAENPDVKPLKISEYLCKVGVSGIQCGGLSASSD